MSIALTATLAAVMLGFTGIWLIQVKTRDAGIIDFFWAPGFVVIAAVHGWLAGFNTGLALVGLMVLVWSIRLTSHLVERHRRSSSEDARYATMRRNGGDSFWWKSLFKIFWLQAFLLWLVASPVHVVALSGDGDFSLALLVSGFLLFATGFAIEMVADRQLARFKASKPAPGSLMTKGLFSVCRHPNYLGEMILWAGIALVAFSFTFSPWAIAGPALLIVLMVFISLPLTEAHLIASKPAFHAWSQRTPMLIPRFSMFRVTRQA